MNNQKIEQVSRDKSLKIPKKINVIEHQMNSVEDIYETSKITHKINKEPYDKQKLRKEANNLEKNLNVIDKLPSNSNDLIVITVVKKLGAYVITITEKSPKKYRGVFVNRMQNYCLDALEYLIKANFTKMDSIDNKKRRENFQKEAIIKLKLLGYISMLAENTQCILKKQYREISVQLTEAINLISAWKKSDDTRWKNNLRINS